MIVNDGVSPALLMVGIALSNAAGSGGGAIVLPILIALLGFSQPEAVAISNFIIFVGAVARILVTWREKNPRFPHKVAVSYDFIIILLPLSLFGTTVGVLINQTFPELILAITTCVIYLFVVYSTFKKACSLRRQEKKRKAEDSQPLIVGMP